MRLYLIRHGQTAWNAEGRAQGHADIPLDAHGEAQANAVGEAFRHIHLDAVLSSDLDRASNTAKPICTATGTPLLVDARLRERSMGVFEGQPFDAFRVHLRAMATPDDPYHVDARLEGGESARDVWDRLEGVVESHLAVHPRLAVVSHGGTCSLLLARLLRGTPLTGRAFRFANGSITELSLNANGLWVMERYNDTAHLAGQAFLSGSLDGTHR